MVSDIKIGDTGNIDKPRTGKTPSPVENLTNNLEKTMTSSPLVRQRKNKRLSDVVFLKKYLASGENQAELARKLGITRQSVADRLRRIGKDRIKEAKEAGKVMALLEKGSEGVVFAAFEAGQKEGLRQWSYLETLEQTLADQQSLLQHIKSEIEQDVAIPGRRLKLYQAQLLLMTQAGMVKTCQTLHQVRRDIHKCENIETFFESTVQIMMEEAPDIRRRIYEKLSNEESWKINLWHNVQKRGENNG